MGLMGYIPPKIIVDICVFWVLFAAIVLVGASQKPVVDSTWEQTYQVQSVKNLWAPFLYRRVKGFTTVEAGLQAVLADSLITTIDPAVECPLLTIHHALYQGDTTTMNLSAVVKFKDCDQAALYMN